MSAATTSDVLIIGAGVIGLTAADALSAAGRTVHVIDARDPASGGASVANAGWINPYTVAPLPSPAAIRVGARAFLDASSPLYIRPRLSIGLASWLLRFAAATNARTHDRGRHALVALGRSNGEAYLELAERGGLRMHARTSLGVFATPDGAADAARHELTALPGLEPAPDHEVLDAAAVQALAPQVSDRVQSGLLNHGDLQIEPASILEVLAASIRGRRGRIDHDAAVTELLVRDGRILGVRTSTGAEHHAGTVIVAAGAWSPRLLKQVGVRLRMEPGKGYSVAVQLTRPPETVIAIADAKVGLVPHAGGARLVGTMELSGVNERIDRRRVDGIVAAARPYLRELAESPLLTSELSGEVIVGMRPMFARGLPVIDRVDGIDGLYLSTGHAMMGVTLALTSAARLTEFILDGRRPEVLEPFRLDRA